MVFHYHCLTVDMLIHCPLCFSTCSLIFLQMGYNINLIDNFIKVTLEQVSLSLVIFHLLYQFLYSLKCRYSDSYFFSLFLQTHQV